MIGRGDERRTERMGEAGTMKEGKMIGKKVHQIYDVWGITIVDGKGSMMKAKVLMLLAVLSVVLSAQPALSDWKTEKNVEQRSSISLRGDMEEMFIIQTEKGIAGQKLVFGTMGSGTASRTMTTFIDDCGADECDPEGCGVSFKIDAVYNYHPYSPKTAESDLLAALRAKNLAVGTVASDNYNGGAYLIKDVIPSNEEGVPIFQISSRSRPAARLGSW